MTTAYHCFRIRSDHLPKVSRTMSSALSSSAKKSQSKAEAWQQVFGIQTDPFVNNFRSFYPGGQRQENLNALRHLAHYSNRILLVTGNKDSGKTFLLDRLCACEKEALKLARIKPKLLQSRTNLLRNMAEMIDLSVNSKTTNADLIDKIRMSCEKRFASGFKTLFIIDDAQDLSNDSLELLVSFFRPETQPVCGLLLLSQVQIIGQIRKICARSNAQPFHQIQLKTFTQGETVAYVEHYLASAGWDKSVALSPQICARLHLLGQGLPGRINRIAPSVLLSESMPPCLISRRHLLLFSGVLAAVLSLTFIVIGYQYLLDDGDSKAEAMGKQTTGKQKVTLKTPGSEDFKLTNEQRLPPQVLALNKQLNEEQEKLTAESVSQPQSSHLRTQDWIDAQAEGSWTIQILGVRDEKIALSFLKESPFTGDYFYVKSSYKSEDWYVVLQGVYPSKEASKTGLRKLPAKLRSSGAWPRSLAGLQSR